VPRRQIPIRVLRREVPVRLPRRQIPIRLLRREVPVRAPRRQIAVRVPRRQIPVRVLRRQIAVRLLRREVPVWVLDCWGYWVRARVLRGQAAVPDVVLAQAAQVVPVSRDPVWDDLLRCAPRSRRPSPGPSAHR
jgi:hypothetical protein